ncbi:MAG: PilZ domain-containing protein [Myxococcales bacterium]
MHELRRHPRVEFDRKVWCEHQALTLYLPVSNVSVGGMFLQTSARFRVGDTVRVSLELEETTGERVVADVEVVWSGKTGRIPGFGCRVVRFSEGESAYMRLVDRLVARA